MTKARFENFRNEGFGWICTHCEQETAVEETGGKLSRLMSEGEAESKAPRFSNTALARWADGSRNALFCPRCNFTEVSTN